MSQIRKYTLTVTDKVVETDDACTIKFKQPSLKKISYLPGQFLTLILNINGRIYQRPYSISSVYKIDATIDITVKAIKDGKVSNYIKNNLEVGQTVEIVEPLGSFILPDLLPPQVVLWAAGSGISPIFALLKAILYQTEAKVFLNYSSPSKLQTILLAQIEDLQKKYPDRFQLNLFLSKEVASLANIGQHDNKLNLQNMNELVIKNKLKDASLHYICGPNEYNVFLQQNLIIMGCLAGNIFVEEFNQVLNVEDLKGVIDANVCITKEGIEHKVVVKKGNNILEAALDNEIDIQYSCQTGTCELCKGSIISGQVSMIVHHKKEIKKEGDNCLLCCSLPLTSEILISVN